MAAAAQSACGDRHFSGDLPSASYKTVAERRSITIQDVKDAIQDASLQLCMSKAQNLFDRAQSLEAKEDLSDAHFKYVQSAT
jgi:hypothetical protein